MEYDKMTKAELIEKLENLSHLGTTVHAKNKQINDLKEQKKEQEEKYKMIIKELKSQLEDRRRRRRRRRRG